jgi:hypothetical protein
MANLLIALSFDDIVVTIVDNDESSSSMSSSKLRRTNAQPTISWLPRTDEQVCVVSSNILYLNQRFETDYCDRTPASRIEFF